MRDQTPLRVLQTLCGALIILAAATACAGPREAAVDIDALLGGVETLTEQPARPTEVAEAQPTDVPPTEVVPVHDENCVECHTNQEMLMSLATEAEPEESHSTGEG